MPYDPQKFVNPGQFGSWENYANFKDTDQMTSLKDLYLKSQGMGGAEGVPPPQSMGEVAQQAIAPVQQKFNNLSNAATQLGQGNVVNAFNASQGKYPAPAQTLPNLKPPTPATSSHSYDDQW